MPRRWICATCGSEFWRASLTAPATYCSRDCKNLGQTVPLVERFWRYVQKSDGCWEWTGYRGTGGYGQIGEGTGQGRNLTAHRVSWLLHFGSIPPGLFVCHHCDNPPCVRPDHLFLGTAQINVADRERKGRGAKGAGLYALHPERRARGERVHLARLTEDQVREIRARYAAGGVKQSDLARAYNVSRGSIGPIVRGETWRHVS